VERQPHARFAVKTNGKMNLRIGIVQINVTDLAEAWRFYVGKLGLRGKETLGPGKAFELELGSGGPAILVYPVPRMGMREYPSETGVVLVLYTDDIRSTVNAWKAKGVSFIPIAWARDSSGIADSPFGPFIAFRDPFGNVHELSQPSASDQGKEQ
jgi:catechol 2,3-dioxygenase-like lactoylglutathione lyase family enzyme